MVNFQERMIVEIKSTCVWGIHDKRVHIYTNIYVPVFYNFIAYNWPQIIDDLISVFDSS